MTAQEDGGISGMRPCVFLRILSFYLFIKYIIKICPSVAEECSTDWPLFVFKWRRAKNNTTWKREQDVTDEREELQSQGGECERTREARGRRGALVDDAWAICRATVGVLKRLCLMFPVLQGEVTPQVRSWGEEGQGIHLLSASSSPISWPSKFTPLGIIFLSLWVISPLPIMSLFESHIQHAIV